MVPVCLIVETFRECPTRRKLKVGEITSSPLAWESLGVPVEELDEAAVERKV